jgi:hypothetical protein
LFIHSAVLREWLKRDRSLLKVKIELLQKSVNLLAESSSAASISPSDVLVRFSSDFDISGRIELEYCSANKSPPLLISVCLDTVNLHGSPFQVIPHGPLSYDVPCLTFGGSVSLPPIYGEVSSYCIAAGKFALMFDLKTHMLDDPVTVYNSRGKRVKTMLRKQAPTLGMVCAVTVGTSLEGIDIICAFDSENHRVRVFDLRHLNEIDEWGSFGRLKHQFSLISSMVLLRDNRLFMCDRTNKRVQIFSLTGKLVACWRSWAKSNGTRDQFNEIYQVTASENHLFTLEKQPNRVCCFAFDTNFEFQLDFRPNTSYQMIGISCSRKFLMVLNSSVTVDIFRESGEYLMSWKPGAPITRAPPQVTDRFALFSNQIYALGSASCDEGFVFQEDFLLQGPACEKVIFGQMSFLEVSIPPYCYMSRDFRGVFASIECTDKPSNVSLNAKILENNGETILIQILVESSDSVDRSILRCNIHFKLQLLAQVSGIIESKLDHLQLSVTKEFSLIVEPQNASSPVIALPLFADFQQCCNSPPIQDEVISLAFDPVEQECFLINLLSLQLFKFKGLDCVQKIEISSSSVTSSSVTKRIFQPPSFWGGKQLCFDQSSLIVLDPVDKRLLRFGRFDYVPIIKELSAVKLLQPTSIYLSGNFIYVCDSGHTVVQVNLLNGEVANSWKRFSNLVCVEVSQRCIYALCIPMRYDDILENESLFSGCIQTISFEGTYLYQIGFGEIERPLDLCVFNDEFVIVLGHKSKGGVAMSVLCTRTGEERYSIQAPTDSKLTSLSLDSSNSMWILDECGKIYFLKRS